MDDGVCFSPGAIALLAAIGGILQAAIVTLFWLLIRSYQAQIEAERAEKLEWKRVAVRGSNDIIPTLTAEVRPQVRELIRGLQELHGPPS